MSRPDYTVDAEGLTRAWATTFPGLCGPGNPIPAGVHLTRRRGGNRGTACTVELIGPRDVDLEGAGDSARVSFAIYSIGSEDGARRAAHRGARAVAAACRTMTGSPVAVTSRPGQPDEETAVLGLVHTVSGPLLTGDVGGEITYRVDATFVWRLPMDGTP